LSGAVIFALAVDERDIVSRVRGVVVAGALDVGPPQKNIGLAGGVVGAHYTKILLGLAQDDAGVADRDAQRGRCNRDYSNRRR